MDWLAFKTTRSQINQDAFALAMLRHMVELDIGKLSDAEYLKAESTTAARLQLKLHGERIDLRHMSAGTLSYISSQIVVTVAASRAGKAEAIS